MGKYIVALGAWLITAGVLGSLIGPGEITKDDANSDELGSTGTNSDELGDLIIKSTNPIKGNIYAIISNASEKNRVPVAFSEAIAQQESGLNPKSTGKAGEIGLFQIKCATARELGFQGYCEELYKPKVNAFWGTLHLRKALDRSNGDFCKAATLHNRGLHAKLVRSTYCEEVLARL